MYQLLKSRSEPHRQHADQQTAKLKARLARTDRIIAQLKAEKAQLREQVAQLQRRTASSKVKLQSNSQPQSGAIAKQTHHPPIAPLSSHRATSRDRPRSSTVAQRPRRQATDRQRVQKRSPRQLRPVGIVILALSLATTTFLSLQRLQQPRLAPIASPSSNLLEPAQPPQPAEPTMAKVQTLEELAYNVQPSPLEHDEALQSIVDGAMALAASKDLSTQPLSITLIDLKSNKTAGYQNQTLRYPASVVKLFWLVVCEAQLEQGFLQDDAALAADLNAMIVHSDNDAASRVFDRITQTTSGNALNGSDYDTWLKHRLQLNQFFRAAGFDGLSISQKNYPIYSLRLDGPDGRELQMRDEQQQPIRSIVSSDQAARLMYDLYTGKAISASRSQAMMALLTRDLHPDVWKTQPDNAIAGFLGELLPPDIHFASKVGLTTKARHEVAFVASKDGKTAYILAVFGADPTYSQNTEILPAISHAVYTQMMERSARVEKAKG